MAKKPKPEAQNQFLTWKYYPDQMVRDLFNVEPDTWQANGLRSFPDNPRIAMKASKGVGKTTELAWMAWNFLLTRSHPKMTAISISSANLHANFWTEMALWRSRSDLLKQKFTYTQKRIFANEAPDTWWLEARSWPKSANREEQSATLAGLHADNIMFILDESGSMPDAIMASADAALSSCKEGHIVQAGNPTHLSGPLYRACTKDRRLWHVIEINGDPDNPDRAPRISREWAIQQIEQWGRDDPFVLVNVFGQFPSRSLDSLIGPDEIIAATKRSYHISDVERSPKILGVDVARGGDDMSVIFPRQGLVAFAQKRHRSLDGIAGAGIVSRLWEDWGVDACFVDDTGGFGAAWNDCLRLLHRSPIPILFNQKASNPRYFNKRTEMYFEAAQWIRNGGQLPPMSTPGMNELLASMTETTYGFKGDSLYLEPKDLVKSKIGYSPDDSDALALTFAQPVGTRSKPGRQTKMLSDYEPYGAISQGTGRQGTVKSDYEPYGGL